MFSVADADSSSPRPMQLAFEVVLVLSVADFSMVDLLTAHFLDDDVLGNFKATVRFNGLNYEASIRGINESELSIGFNPEISPQEVP